MQWGKSNVTHVMWIRYCDKCHECYVTNIKGQMQYDKCYMINVKWQMQCDNCNMTNAMWQKEYDKCNVMWKMQCVK